MAIVVRLPSVIGDKTHRVVRLDEVRVFIDEFYPNTPCETSATCEVRSHTFHRVPEGRNSCGILIQGDGETVDLLVLLHEEERLRRDVSCAYAMALRIHIHRSASRRRK